MNSKLLTFKDTKTGKRFVFNPIFIGCICEHYQVSGAITITLISGTDEVCWVINYDYEVAQKRW